MSKGRLEAFSDGFIAIIITIMVLDFKAPQGSDLAALQPLIPVFLSYILSFIYIGIYWNNHHHLLQASRLVTGPILWANLHLLFWLSLIPFTTRWMAGGYFASTPVALYGCNLILAAVAYWILVQMLLRGHGEASELSKAIGRDFKGKISVVIYALAIVLTFWSAWAGLALYVMVALMWLVPDRRIERVLRDRK